MNNEKHIDFLKKIYIEFISFYNLEYKHFNQIQFLNFYFNEILPSNKNYFKNTIDYRLSKKLPLEYKNKFKFIEKTRELFNSINNYKKLINFQNKNLNNKYYIFNKFTFNLKYSEFDIDFYRREYKINSIVSDEKVLLNYLLVGIKNRYLYSKKFIFVFYAPLLWYEIGGIVAVYNMVRLINQQKNPNYCAKIFNIFNVRFSSEFNNINDFITEEEVNDNCIVIYPEIVSGNPLNAKNVVRWILLAIGIETKQDTVDTWNKNDLICNWESEDKDSILRKHYIKKNYFYIPNYERVYTCGLIKKGVEFNKNFKHKKFFEIDLDKILKFDTCANYINNICLKIFGKTDIINEENIDDLVCRLFNKSKIFFTYDVKTMWIVYALICNCPVVIIPPVNFNKKDFFNQSIFNYNGEILNDGIGWGIEEKEFAIKTVERARDNIKKIFSIELENSVNKINSIYNHFKNKYL